MKKKAPKKNFLLSSKKALKSPLKAIGKVVKKIKASGKKISLRPKILIKKSKEKLVLKRSFSKIIKDPVVPKTAQLLSEPAVADRRLPEYYGEDKIVLLVRDPWWLFAYWEVTPGCEARVMAEISVKGLRRQKTVLRVYDLTAASSGTPPVFFDIEIQHLNNNWYIDVGQPDREWAAEIGFKTEDGQFFVLIRSNTVRTPSFGISDVLDEEWMMPDSIYFKLLGVIGGFEGIGNSMEIRKMFERRIRQSASSESSPKLASASGGKPVLPAA